MTSIPGLIGPGSQPGEADGATADILHMPSGMLTFTTAHVPEADVASSNDAGVAACDEILAALRDWNRDGQPRSVSLDMLDLPNRAFVRQLLGEGEVSVIGGSTIQAQESVLAGVWYVRATPDGEAMKEWVEVAAFPPSLLAVAFQDATDELPVEREFPENVFNAPPLIPEINEHLPSIADGELTNHVINLSLLPHTPEDLTYLDAILGKGPLIILSRGYGNCRIRSTGTRNCWWVRYYNSQDTLILNSIELSLIPSVALAAPEDLADSEERLSEIMDIYR